MDALGLALANIRLVSPLLARLQLGGNVSVAMGSGSSGGFAASFHYIERGRCRLVMENGVPFGTTVLKEGDIVLFPRWPDYRVETGPAARTIPISEVAKVSPGATWTLEDGIDTPVDVQAGEPPYEVELLGGIFAFDSARAASLLKELPDCIHMNADRDGLAAPLKGALGFVQSGGGRPGFAAVAQRLLEALLIDLLRTWALDSDHAPGHLRALADAALAPALHAIHERPGNRWTVSSLAAVAGRSRSSFAAHFVATVGMPPAEYLAEWRCQVAERRFASGASTAEVAYELGYESSFAFARMFQRMRGVTPRQYRIKQRH